MNREEIEQEIKNKEKEIEELKLKLSNTRWRAEKGKPYYTLSYIGGAFRLIDSRGKTDNYRYKLKNYFQTIEQAEEYRKAKDLVMSNKCELYTQVNVCPISINDFYKVRIQYECGTCEQADELAEALKLVLNVKE